MFCDRPATRLCDKSIGLIYLGETERLSKGVEYRVTSMEAMLSHSHTCDASMCERHQVVVGFICGKEGDTIDYCIGCHLDPAHPGGLMTPDEIDAERRRLHALYRRTRMYVSNTGKAEGGGEG